MVIEVDVTKFRVQPFRSYKVCINLEDSPTNSHLDEVCSHLFSFEKYVPYIPDEEKIVITNKTAGQNTIDPKEKDVSRNFENTMKDEKVLTGITNDNKTTIKIETLEDIESVLKHQLEDINNYVKDDFKSEFLEIKDKIVEEIDLKITNEIKVIHSSSSEPLLDKIILICLILFFHIFLKM